MRTMFTVLLLALAGQAMAQDRTPAPAEARVYIISPKDGDTVKNPVTVRFGLSGMGVAPAGVESEGTCLLYTSPSPRD